MEKRIIYLIAIALVLAVIAIAVNLLPLSSSVTLNATSYDNMPVNQTILNMLNVPNNAFARIGPGSIGAMPQAVNGTMLTLGGKPEILYIGAEYCPMCAADRWPLIIALMRFGEFKNLHYMTSSPTDIAPNTATFTFYNSTYTSNYISFVSLELTKNIGVGGVYPPLQSPNATEQAIMEKYNVTGIPFIDFANRSVMYGAAYLPTVIQGMNWYEIASEFNNASSPQAQAIIGSANLFTAEICTIDNNTPASVCNESYVKAIENRLG